MNHSARIAVIALLAVGTGLAACSNGRGGAGGGSAGGSAAGGGSAVGGGGGGAGGGSTGGGTGLDAGTMVSQAQFCAGYVKAYCDREVGCAFMDTAKRAACDSRIAAQCAEALKRVTAGLQTYRPAQGGACIEFVKADGCDQGRNFFGSGTAFPYGCLTDLGPGAAAGNSVCELTADCLSGQCQGSAPACRACQPFLGAGSVCDQGASSCEPASTYCKTGSDGGRVCTAFSALGDPCGSTVACDPATSLGCAAGNADGGVRRCLPLLADGKPCSFSTDCSSRRCNVNGNLDGGTNTCGFLALGAACASNRDCGAGNFCRDLNLGPLVPGACRARIALGAPCTIQDVDLFDGCTDEGHCFDRTCKASGKQLIGQQCYLAPDCIPAAQCLSATDGGVYGSCGARFGPGASCTDPSECLLGSFCDNTFKLCRLYSSLGGPCAVNNDCKELLACPAIDAGTGSYRCTDYLGPGAPCGAINSVCATDTAVLQCVNVDAGTLSDGGAAQAQRCSQLGAVGSPATGDTQCASGRCLGADAGFCSATNVGVCVPSCVP